MYGDENTLKAYGISQNPDTKDYIMVLQDEYYEKYCEKCDKKYQNIFKWCRPCQTSGNKQIDDFIQEKQLKINWKDEIGFEWILYSQFYCTKEISKGDYATIYSALWNDGPLYYDNSKWARKSGLKVTLKCFYYSNKLLN